MRLEIRNIALRRQRLQLDLTVSFEDAASFESPRLVLCFSNGKETRRIPFPCHPYQSGSGKLSGSYAYDLSALFWEKQPLKQVEVDFFFQLGAKETHLTPAALPKGLAADETIVLAEQGLRMEFPSELRISCQERLKRFFKSTRRDQLKCCTKIVLSALFLPFRCCKIRSNRITFFSNRRADLTGNPVCVYNKLVQEGTFDLHVHFNNGRFGRYDPRVLFRFFYLYATSKVVLVDDYYHFISYVRKPRGVKLIQLWHACGAFKTFGFSRLGKDTKLTQYAENHRQYDAAIVSGDAVCKFYEEGFGLSAEKVVATGIPRTDLLLNQMYRKDVRQQFYQRYPTLQNRKIILFAPTFRGGGKGDAFYPFERFDPVQLCKVLGDEYAILIKLHPYILERYQIPKEYASHIVDCSADSELNELLFVSDLVITDYSSVVFEAALLQVPQLFYAYDLEEYIASRDFYIDFKHFAPGPLIQTAEELPSAIRKTVGHAAQSFEFKQQYLNQCDGTATQRVVQLIRQYTIDEG